MRKLLHTAAVILLMAGAAYARQTGSGLPGPVSPADSAYTLTGHIDGLATGQVWLMHRGTEGKLIDSAEVKDGNFVMKGYASAPHIVLFAIPGENNQKEFRLSFFLEAGQLTLRGSRDSLDKAVITGSASQDEYEKYIAGQQETISRSRDLYKLQRAAKESKDQPRIDSLGHISESLRSSWDKYTMEYFAAHPDSYVTAYLVYDKYGYFAETPKMEAGYRVLSPAMQESYYGRQLRKALEAARRTDTGKAAPLFTQNDVTGKPIALGSYKGRYVLIDFWASWCGPCRAENPNVLKAYKKWHAKGFDVLGVSMDDSKDKWLKAVKEDDLPWKHVSDLKGWKNDAGVLYGISAIPMNFLVDRNGIIVAKSLRGEELDKKLGELLR